MLRAASDSGLCVCAHLCYRQESAIKLQKRKGLDPPHPLHTCMTFLICHQHFFDSLSLCILIIRISDNLKSFFYPNDCDSTVYIYIYIYIYRERERESVYVSVYQAQCHFCHLSLTMRHKMLVLLIKCEYYLVPQI